MEFFAGAAAGIRLRQGPEARQAPWNQAKLAIGVAEPCPAGAEKRHLHGCLRFPAGARKFFGPALEPSRPPAAQPYERRGLPTQPIADEVLIGRIAQADRRAMEALFARYRLPVYRFLLRMVRNPSMAEDLNSDVFLDVWRQAATFEGRSAVSTWIFGIARYKALTALQRRPTEELDDERAGAIEDEADNPEVALAKKDKAAALRGCLQKLSAEHREIVTLVYYQHKSVEEVAGIVGIPEATVKTRMFYARKKLSELLAARGIDRGWP
jgi:RNA polymerase sigma-70 factor, ECF subfamily